MADAPEVRVEVRCESCRGRAIPDECPDCEGTGTETRTLTGLDALAVAWVRAEGEYVAATRAVQAEARLLGREESISSGTAWRFIRVSDITRTAKAALDAALLAEGGKDG